MPLYMAALYRIIHSLRHPAASLTTTTQGGARPGGVERSDGAHPGPDERPQKNKVRTLVASV